MTGQLGKALRTPPREQVRLTAWLGVLAAFGVLALLLALFAQQAWWDTALRWLFPTQRSVTFTGASLWQLALEHLQIVGVAALLIVGIGVPLGILLTRPQGRAFLPLASNLLSIGQTFPPVAVLALALPFFGFGLTPTLIALVAYGLLPVTRNTIAGIQAVPAVLREAAEGQGMGPWQQLWRLELPLATRIILAGVRISVIYTIGTATVAPIIGAGGLGQPIVAGLATSNLAYVIQGALPVAMLALTIDYALGRLELALTPTGLR